MKKLLFATAIAASAAAFAAPLTAVDFEGANDYQPNQQGSRFYFDGESNSSVVSNDANAASTTKRTANYAEANNANFLALDTEGGTLWRSINEINTTDGYNLGTAKTVAADGTYLDTLVQFTVTEDEAPTVGEGDKLAIWLQAGEGTTNLMVKAAVIDDIGTPTETNFTLNATVNPGEWYRLTIKAIADITDNEGLPGFQIYLDGALLTSSTPTLTSEYLDILGPDDVDDSHYADLVAGKYFASLSSATTLQGVGFQGTGAVDEIVWTEEDPFPAAVVEFTLTRSIGENVTAAAFTIGEDAITFENDAASIVSNATVTIAQPTFAQGYQLAALTIDGTAVADPVFPYSFPMTANTTVAITAEQIPASYPNYVGDNATLQGQYDTWKTTYGADSESAYEKQFLLNTDPTTTVADDALQIDSITENATDGWDIVVSTTVTGAALSDGTKTTYNGYLLVKSADTLAGLATATPVAYPVTAVTGGKVSINVTSGKFMKVELTTTAPAQN